MVKFVHQPHDKFFKKTMSNLRVAKEFLQTHLPKELLNKIDFNSLCLEDASFIDDLFKSTEADLVYSVKIMGETAYFYLLCEQQSRIDHMMPFRLVVYQIRIIEYHFKKYGKGKLSLPLPLVYPLVVYSGKELWDAPRRFFELFGENEFLAEKFFCEPFHLIDV